MITFDHSVNIKWDTKSWMHGCTRFRIWNQLHIIQILIKFGGIIFFSVWLTTTSKAWFTCDMWTPLSNIFLRLSLKRANGRSILTNFSSFFKVVDPVELIIINCKYTSSFSVEYHQFVLSLLSHWFSVSKQIWMKHKFSLCNSIITKFCWKLEHTSCT